MDEGNVIMVKKEVVLVFVKFFYFLYILKLNYDKNIEEFILSIF